MLSKRDTQIKQLLDYLVLAYKTPQFITSDPVSIPHRFKHDKKAAELTAFLAALFTYGQRPKIIALLNNLLSTMNNDPVGFVENFNPKKEGKLFKNFVYRFNTGDDLIVLLSCLQHAYKEYQSLENMFTAHKQPDNLQQSIGGFLDELTRNTPPQSSGLKFLFAHPRHGGPCKRFNLFLRWVVRKDAADLGLWHTALGPAELTIPLDTHVQKCNRLFKFSKRKSPDWQQAAEITAALQRFNPQDPMAYDYALMGLGLALNTAGLDVERVSLSQLLLPTAQVVKQNCVLPAAAIS